MHVACKNIKNIQFKVIVMTLNRQIDLHSRIHFLNYVNKD